LGSKVTQKNAEKMADQMIRDMMAGEIDGIMLTGHLATARGQR
jgi:hypothetical protein